MSLLRQGTLRLSAAADPELCALARVGLVVRKANKAERKPQELAAAGHAAAERGGRPGAVCAGARGACREKVQQSGA